jgi:hypothetical protein
MFQLIRATLTLSKGSLDLTDIDTGIDTPSDIHMNITSHDHMITRQHVHLDLRHRSPLRKVEERFPLARDPRIPNLRGLIMPMSLQIDPIKERRVSHLRPRSVWHLFTIRSESGVELFTGVFDGHSVQIGSGTGGGGRGIDDRHGVGLHDVDLFDRTAEFCRADLSHLCV